MQFFYNFLLDANDSIINVLSPNTIERTDVYAVKSVIENISPSINKNLKLLDDLAEVLKDPYSLETIVILKNVDEIYFEDEYRKALFNFLNWIVFTYSSTYESRTFDETLIPTNKATIIVKKNQEEIDKYRSELDEKEQSIADLKKQLADLQKALTSNKSKPKDDSKINYETIDEKTTRKLFIDEDLKKLGWQFDGVMVQEEYPVHDMGDKHSDGFVDYVLFGKDHKPLAVVEAKKTSKDPNIGKQQAKDYADCLEREYGQRPFIFYTNGFDCNFWDDLQAAPRRGSPAPGRCPICTGSR